MLLKVERSMYNDAGICYWMLWLCNSKVFWSFTLIGLTVLAFWPIIVNRLEEKAYRITNRRNYASDMTDRGES